MLTVVFDTVVFVRSLINPYSFCGKVVFAHADKYQLVLSRPVVVEMVEVLFRPELTGKFTSLAGMDRTKVLDIISQAPLAALPEEVPMVSRDIKDNKFYATAKAAGAPYVVSADRDLLDIGEHDGVKFITCEEFLRILEV